MFIIFFFYWFSRGPAFLGSQEAALVYLDLFYLSNVGTRTINFPFRIGFHLCHRGSVVPQIYLHVGAQMLLRDRMRTKIDMYQIVFPGIGTESGSN